MSEATPNPAQVTTDAGKGAAAVTDPVAQPGSQAAPPAATPEKPPEVKPSVVPEKYDLKLPEGAQIKPDQLEKIASFAKEQGFSQEQAQKYLERENAVLSDFVKSQEDGLKTQTQAWVESVKGDKELGGEKFKENMEVSLRAVQKFCSPDFVKLLNDTGLGNHPELVRAFYRIGSAMKEDSLVIPGAQGASAGKSAAELLYGGTKP
jgi:hypothetical protein